VEERDRLGFDRFSLVVTGDDRQAERMARATFEAVAPSDGRVHLHVVSVGLLPGPVRDAIDRQGREAGAPRPCRVMVTR
jgi:hypothetical protein